MDSELEARVTANLEKLISLVAKRVERERERQHCLDNLNGQIEYLIRFIGRLDSEIDSLRETVNNLERRFYQTTLDHHNTEGVMGTTLSPSGLGKLI